MCQVNNTYSRLKFFPFGAISLANYASFSQTYDNTGSLKPNTPYRKTSQNAIEVPNQWMIHTRSTQFPIVHSNTLRYKYSCELYSNHCRSSITDGLTTPIPVKGCREDKQENLALFTFMHRSFASEFVFKLSLMENGQRCLLPSRK